MILVFPQATKKFNDLYQEMLKESCINDFLDISLGSYDLKIVKKVVIILLENDVVEKHLNNYLNECEKINNFQDLKCYSQVMITYCNDTTLLFLILTSLFKKICSVIPFLFLVLFKLFSSSTFFLHSSTSP